MPTGWFARATIPAYCIYLTVHFTEQEAYLLRHTGVGHYVLFQAPIPHDVTDSDEIKKLKAENFGLFLVRVRLRRDLTPSLPAGAAPRNRPGS